MSHDKLRILVLHGYRQNAEIFKRSTKVLVDSLSIMAKFVYLTAPHEVLLVDNADVINSANHTKGKQNAWFFNRNDLTNRGVRNGGPAIGFEETVKLIQYVFETYGPFDGILGFSQGACLAALLCDLQQRGLLKITFHFAIIIGGFKSRCLSHMKYFGDIIKLPTLHIIGNEDCIIPNEMSELLADCFEEPVFLRHGGGHIVPVASEDVEEYQKFVYAQYLSKNFS